MAATNHDCPYCGGRQSAFEYVAQTPSFAVPGMWAIIGRCGTCGDFALLKLISKRKGPSKDPISFAKSNPIDTGFSVTSIVPNAPSIEMPFGLPENVQSAFSDAEKCFLASLWGPAASSYRKAMERALKHLNPSEVGMLNKRIRAIEKSGDIPHSLIELLDQVRLFGNEAMHEDYFDPTQEDVDAVREFSILFLTYAFSLPERISIEKQPRAERDQ